MKEAMKTGLRAPLSPILCVAALGFALSACVQSAGTNTGSTDPAMAAIAPATGDPVLLSGATFSGSDPTTTSAVSAATPTATVAPAAASAPAAVASTPVPPPAAASPLPPEQPTVAQPSPPAVATADEFPNVNTPPRQPEGKLLTPEERAKLIAELNALAARQTGGQ